MVELVEDGQRPLVGKEDELVAAFVGREEVGGAAVGLQAGERAAVAVDDDRQGAESGVSEAGADAGRQAGEGAVDVVEAGGVPLLALAEEDDAFRQPALGRPENGGRCDGLPSRSLARGAGLDCGVRGGGGGRDLRQGKRRSRDRLDNDAVGRELRRVRGRRAR